MVVVEVGKWRQKVGFKFSRIQGSVASAFGFTLRVCGLSVIIRSVRKHERPADERRRNPMGVMDWVRLLMGSDLTINDPIFGNLRGQRIKLRKDQYVYWVADRYFTKFGELAPVCVFSDECGPTVQQRSLYEQLLTRYAELRELITEPLAQEYELIRSSWALESPILQTPADVWKLATLSRIEINHERHRNSELVLDHSVNWDAEHALNVAITNWRVDEVMLEG